ncbi:MAG: dihydropyrimidinase, partial [Desulfobacula sp.]|nr:dihydropyrimidinase [Desulfobacula sp.]
MILIKNASIVAPDGVIDGDLLVIGETIADIGPNIQVPDTESNIRIIEAKGKLILPGGIDVHTHFNLDVGIAVAQDDFYTGTVAAACGGTTTIVDHPGFGPKGCSLFHQIDLYHEYAKDNAVIDYSFHGVLQHLDSKIIEQIPKLADAGISSMKAYMIYDYGFSKEMLGKLLTAAKSSDVLIAVHAEDDKMVNSLRAKYVSEGKTAPIYHALSRPDEAEALAIKNLIEQSQKAGNAPVYIVHLSTQKGLELIQEAQARGLSVFAETCPQYLLFDETAYNEDDLGGLKYLMSPPLRKKQDIAALWKGLENESISTLATDHCPFDLKLKKKLGGHDFSQCPGGAPGVETRMPVFFTKAVKENKISLRQFVRITAENPAKLMGLYPQKGVLQKGADADLIMIDPNEKKTISSSMLHENVDYTLYEGMEVFGWPQMTMSRGKIIVKNGSFIGSKGYG